MLHNSSSEKMEVSEVSVKIRREVHIGNQKSYNAKN